MSGEPDRNTPIRLTAGDLRMIVGDMTKATGDYVREVTAAVTAPLERQIRELTERVERLERVKYCGIWKSTNHYVTGSSCTLHNHYWIALADNYGSRPGTSRDWQLAARSGNGKD